MHIIKADHLDHIDHLNHLDHLDHLDHSYESNHSDNAHWSKIYYEDNYRICIVYLV